MTKQRQTEYFPHQRNDKTNFEDVNDEGKHSDSNKIIIKKN